MNRIHSILIVAAIACVIGSGCRPAIIKFDSLYKGSMASDDEKLVALRARHQELIGKYEQAVVTLNQDIATYKSEIDAHIKSNEIGPALSKIKAMDKDLHGDTSTRHLVVKEEGISEVAYVKDASKRALVAVDNVIASGQFQKLDTWLSEREGLPADAATKEGFAQKHEKLYGLWLEFLKKEVDRAAQSTPGSALIYALKAESLAIQIKDSNSSQKMSARADALRRELVQAHGFVFAITSASGPNASDVASTVSASSWGDAQIKCASSKTSRTNASLTFSLGTPSYKSYTSSTKGSFKYQSGTKEVTNPKYERAQRDVSHAQGILDGHEHDLEVANQNSDYAGKAANMKAKRKQIAEAREDLQEYQQKLASVPQTVTQPVYDTYSYPITVHHMDASLSLNSELTSDKGLKSVSTKTSVTTGLTDEEHASHSKNDGSVGADPARPPSKSSALDSLKGGAKSKLKALVSSGFTVHRDALAQKAQGDRDTQVHWLAIYTLLDPDTASQDAVNTLESTAQIKGVKALLKP